MSTEPLRKENWDYDDIEDQSGKVFVVTGANSGLGFSAARGLAARNATVVMACRSQERAEEAADAIRKDHSDADLDVILLDLASLDSVRQFAEEFSERYDYINGLVNNAGIMQPPYRRTEDGFELQMGVNHFGHFALTGLLLDRIKATPGARVVVQSSFAHEMADGITFDDINSEEEYSRTGAYAQSKLANLFFAFELDRRFEKHDINAMAVGVHPGYTATNLQFSGPGLEGWSLWSFLYGITNKILAQSVEMGALPLLYAAVEDDVKRRDYIGPGGFFEARGYPARVEAAETAYDETEAEKLWDLSEELTGVTYSF